MATLDNLEDGPNWIWESRLRLARRREKKPDTKAGRIRALWPEIAGALEGGQSVKSIRQWLEEDAGIAVGITGLTSYISRIKRRESATQRAQNSLPLETIAVNHSAAPGAQAAPNPAHGAPPLEPPRNVDPIAQAMRALTKPQLDIRKLHSDGDLNRKKPDLTQRRDDGKSNFKRTRLWTHQPANGPFRSSGQRRNRQTRGRELAG